MARHIADRACALRILCVVVNVAFGITLSACSAGDVKEEQEGKHSSPIVWNDNLTTQDDLLRPEISNDQRREVFEEQDGFAHGDAELPGYAWLRSFAQESTVTLIQNFKLTERRQSDQRFLAYPAFTSLRDEKKLCAGQQYADQPAPGFCSGTLIDDDLLLTAAHCVFFASPDPAESRAVFNHYNIANGALADVECDTPAGEVCESKDVFRFRPILVGDRFADTDEDWALVQLIDAQGNPRSATPRYRPAPVRLDGTPSDLGTPLAKAGAPSGLPLKIALSKRVRGQGGVARVTAKSYLSFMDNFQGDSGGGIYDATTFELVALVSGGPNFLVGGKASDYIPQIPQTTRDTCNVVGTCPLSAARKAELEAADVQVLCQDDQGTLFPEVLVRADVPLAHLCGIGTGVPPLPFFSPPPGFESERLCTRPTNESCETAEPVDLKFGHELTLSGDTSAFAHDGDSSCGATTNSPDAFYRFEVTQPTMFYADTFGPANTYDTVLFLQKDCPASSEINCSDDSTLCPGEGNSPANRSRFAVPLDPGTYFLGISGFGGASGRYAVHVQALALSDNGILLDSSDLGAALFIDEDTNNSLGSGSEQICSLPGGKDFQVLYATCPDYVGGPMFASTCDALTSFDTVLSFKQGGRPFTACNDDMAVPICFRQSAMGFDSLVRVNSGSGIRSLVVDGFSEADSGRFGLNVTFPP